VTERRRYLGRNKIDANDGSGGDFAAISANVRGRSAVSGLLAFLLFEITIKRACFAAAYYIIALKITPLEDGF
jgi:hypothetical protein